MIGISHGFPIPIYAYLYITRHILSTSFDFKNSAA